MGMICQGIQAITSSQPWGHHAAIPKGSTLKASDEEPMNAKEDGLCDSPFPWLFFSPQCGMDSLQCFLGRYGNTLFRWMIHQLYINRSRWDVQMNGNILWVGALLSIIVITKMVVVMRSNCYLGRSFRLSAVTSILRRALKTSHLAVEVQLFP